MLVIILQYSIVTSDKISKDTEAADFVKINICVILKTFGHDCTQCMILLKTLCFLLGPPRGWAQGLQPR